MARFICDTDFPDIVAQVFQGDSFAAYMLRICQDYVLRQSVDLIKENGLKQREERSRRYTAETMTQPDYTVNLVFHANTLV